MKKLDIDEATKPLCDYAKKVKTEPLLVTKKGKPVAALLSVEGADAESLDLGSSPQFIAIIEASKERLRTEGGISSKEMRRRLGIKKL